MYENAVIPAKAGIQCWREFSLWTAGQLLGSASNWLLRTIVKLIPLALVRPRIKCLVDDILIDELLAAR